MTELDPLTCSSGFMLNIMNKLDILTELTKKELHNLDVVWYKNKKKVGYKVSQNCSLDSLNSRADLRYQMKSKCAETYFLES